MSDSTLYNPPAQNELLVIRVSYGGRDNQILKMSSINLTPQQASELVKTISVLVCGYPELDKLEQPENELLAALEQGDK